ncbi:MAG: hypothetical protein J4N64_08135 [Chloroflexi bacterium]|nr:hypothetical protein [Chloroflexota bacterium]
MPHNRRVLWAALFITAISFLIYWDVLWPADPSLRYPWSYDSWGHLIKAEYLQEQIATGTWYPDIFPQWYNGQQMLRYYAPLPYYALVGLLPAAGDVFVAANWFLFIAALFGGLSMLLYARRYGPTFAMFGGVLLVLMPDNIRVAFAEGNLPRVFAAALLPAAFFCLLNVLTADRRRGYWFAGLAGMTALVVLSHAMMGAIFAACFSLFVVVYWLTGKANSRYVLQGLLGIFTGVLLSSWWLLPSLTGGITELNVEAATEALAKFPWNVAFNPSVRQYDKEALYVGLTFLLTLSLGWVYWKHLDGVMRAMLIVGVVTLTISSTLVSGLYSALPLSHLFWPLRFMTFSGFLLVLLTVALISTTWGLSGRGRRSFGRFAAVGIVALMLLDFWQSASLVVTAPAPEEITHVAELLEGSSGWRVATADLSLLGSSPSYLFSTGTGREQVFGWAYQGAATAPLLASINQAIEKGFAAYALDRLDRLGSDDIVVLKTTSESRYHVSEEFREALPDAGYELTYRGRRLELYQRQGGPRAYRVDTRVFAVGSGAQNVSLVFPEILVGSDTALDSYSVEFLSQFDTLILAGFNWRSRGVAEDMVRQLAAGGQRIVIDLTGTPPDLLVRIPRFLDVYGERILLYDPPRLDSVYDLGGQGRGALLQPFDSEIRPWQAYVPQGLEHKSVTFDFQGAQAVAVGTKDVGQGSVTFLGLNLMFHSVLTGDPVAIDVLERELGVKAHRRPDFGVVSLDDYRAGQSGYRFSMDIPEDGLYLLPIARHTGTALFANGNRIPTLTVDTLMLAELPRGRLDVEVRSLKTPVYAAGMATTLVGALITLMMLLPGVKFSRNAFTSMRSVVLRSVRRGARTAASGS